MSTIIVSPLLRLALKLDASISAASGVLLCAASGPLAQQFVLSPNLLLGVGLVCLPYAALLWHLARREHMASAGILVIVIGNLLWADAALLLMLGYGATPSLYGQIYLSTHVIATAAFAILQWFGLRRSQPIAATTAPA